MCVCVWSQFAVRRWQGSRSRSDERSHTSARCVGPAERGGVRWERWLADNPPHTAASGIKAGSQGHGLNDCTVDPREFVGVLRECLGIDIRVRHGNGATRGGNVSMDSSGGKKRKQNRARFHC